MNIYKITQTVNNAYDTYDSAIVYANSAEDAQKIHPSEYQPTWDVAFAKVGEEHTKAVRQWCEDWCHPMHVTATLIGIEPTRDVKPGVILASFNAG